MWYIRKKLDFAFEISSVCFSLERTKDITQSIVQLMFRSLSTFKPEEASVLKFGQTKRRAASKSRKLRFRTLLLSIHCLREYSMLYSAVCASPNQQPNPLHSRQEALFTGGVILSPAMKPLPNKLQFVISFLAKRSSQHQVVKLLVKLLVVVFVVWFCALATEQAIMKTSSDFKVII